MQFESKMKKVKDCINRSSWIEWLRQENKKTFITEGFFIGVSQLRMISCLLIGFHRVESVSEVWIFGFFNNTKMLCFFEMICTNAFCIIVVFFLLPIIETVKPGINTT
jgi:hypothetical protein